MVENVTIFGFLGFALVLVSLFLINDKLKVVKHRLEQQIEQNEQIINLLSKDK